MSTMSKRRSPVYRQLEAYRESWKKDHEEAMECRDWEDAIAVGLNIFQTLREREDDWREQVFRGTVAFVPDDDLDYRNRYSNWLATTKEVVADALPDLEREFTLVNGASELRERAQEAERILSEWQPPHLSAAVGLREMILPAEGAAQLDRILEEAKNQPPKMPAGLIPEEVSAAEFLARAKKS